MRGDERVRKSRPSASPAENTLTVQEIEASYLAEYDLGPGYPQFDVPDWIRRLYTDDSIEELSLRFAPVWSPGKQAQVDEDLERSVRRFLGVPDTVTQRVRATFTGSIALDRSLSAIARLVRQRGKSEDFTVVTTTPSIDIMRLFLEEHRQISTIFVPSRQGGVMGALDLDAFVACLQDLHTAGTTAVALVTSPENPTGATWTASQLRTIAKVCWETNAILFVDHCFATAGIHDEGYVTRIWDLRVKCDWIAIWDTGKTFGLNEDKLGFIFSSGPHIASAVDQALGVVQFGVARRQKMFFAELLRRAIYYDWGAQLRDACRQNLATAAELAPTLLYPPTAGSLLFLDIGATGQKDETIRTTLLKAGVGVVAGNVFFHTEWCPRSFIRLALARRPEYFREALTKLLAVLN